MTPKEKAEELVNKFYNLESEGDKGGWMTFNDAKKCALIAVDEILQMGIIAYWNMAKEYWEEVKNEIEKL
jgi:hypothetical protein